jgi:hypothetical protein
MEVTIVKHHQQLGKAPAVRSGNGFAESSSAARRPCAGSNVHAVQ